MIERQIQHGDERLPMTMLASFAHVPHSQVPPEPPDAPGMIRIPITIHIRLPDLSQGG